MTIATITENTTGTGTLYTGVVDTRIKEAAPTTDYSASSYIEAASWSGGDWSRSLVNFTGLSNITGPVTVTAASIFLRCTDTAVSVNDFDIHRVKTANTIGQVTWNERQTGVSWATAGAFTSTDVDTAASGSAANVAINTWAEFTGAGVIALVEGWINGTYPNYGLLLKRSPETSDATTNEFASSNAGDGLRPYLTVDYTGGSTPTAPAANTSRFNASQRRSFGIRR